MAWVDAAKNATIFSGIADDDFRSTNFGAFVFVAMSAEQRFTLAIGAGSGTNLGVLITDPRTNDHGAVVMAGITKVIAGGAITAGDLITTNTSGRAAAAGSGDIVMGQALTAAGANGEFITINLDKGYPFNVL